MVCSQLSAISCVRLLSALRPTAALPMAPPSTQSLFARSWRYLDQGGVHRLLRGHYFPVLALTDSFVDPTRSPLLRPKPRSRSLCRLRPAPAAGRTFPTSGIERGRASRRWRVTSLALSICKMGSQFHRSYVSRGPPIIPDGRVSQVRLEVLADRQ